MRKRKLNGCGLGISAWRWSRQRRPNGPGCGGLRGYIVAQLGAHIIKIKLPSAKLLLEEARKVYEEQHIPRDTPCKRVRHMVQSAFSGRPIVIFSGGAKTEAATIPDQMIRICRGEIP